MSSNFLNCKLEKERPIKQSNDSIHHFIQSFITLCLSLKLTGLSSWLQTILLEYNQLSLVMSSSRLFHKLHCFCCHSKASHSAKETSIYCTSYCSVQDSQIFLTISTCTNSLTMSNSTELTDREYIVPLCVLNALFALTAVLLNSVTIHAIRKTSSASLSKNLRVLLLNLAFSDLSVGGSCVLQVASVDIAAAISVDCRPTIGRQSVDSRPTIGRLSTDSRPIVGRQSTDSLPLCRSTIGRCIGRYVAINCRPTIGQVSDKCRPSIGLVSAKCRPSVGQVSVQCRPSIGQVAAKYRPSIGQVSVHSLTSIAL